MEATNPDLLSRRWTASELRKLPEPERAAILEAQALIAEEFYRNEPELTAFEAFGEEYFDGELDETSQG